MGGGDARASAAQLLYFAASASKPSSACLQPRKPIVVGGADNPTFVGNHALATLEDAAGGGLGSAPPSVFPSITGRPKHPGIMVGMDQ